MVALSADHGFRIGMPHVNAGLPCQDFALSGVLENGAAYAVVSDGCSKGRHTDVGARAIAFATIDSLPWASQLDLRQMAEIVDTSQVVALKGVMRLLNLQMKDMQATSVYALVTPDRGGLVRLRGDGVIALQHVDGSLEVYTFEPEGNAPIYPAYALDGYYGVRAMHGTDDSVPSLTWQKHKVDDTGAKLLSEGVLNLGEARKGFTLELSPEQVADLRFIGVFSDGVMQVNGLEWHDVVRQLMAFKGTNGPFVVRRMNRFVQTMAQDGKGLMDDLGYAVILIAPDPEPKEGV